MTDESDLIVQRLPTGVPAIKPTQRVGDVRRRYAEVTHEPPRRRDARRLLVSGFMTSPSFTLTEGHTIRRAMELLLERGVQRAPVVDATGRLCGLVSHSDFSAILLAGTRGKHVRDVMSRRVVTVPEDITLREAAEIFIRCGHGGVPVVDAERRPVGFLSARDLLKVLAANAPVELWA